MSKLTQGYIECQPPSSGDVSQAFGEWLDNMASWDWFATLTFRDPGEVPALNNSMPYEVVTHGYKTILPMADLTRSRVRRHDRWSQVGWQFAHKALNNLNSALTPLSCDDGGDEHYLEPIEQPVWVACMELQQRGVPHWHGLFANMGDERRMDWVDWWYANYGIARILPYEERLGARYYLGKYLSKQISDIRFSPALAVHLRRQTQGELAMVSP